MTDIIKTLDSLENFYIKVWEDVCNIDSPTHFKKGVDKVSAYFINLANERGFEVEILKQSVMGDAVCITMNKDAKGTPVSFSGHIDTVHPVGSFGTPAVRFDDENIYGPGVTDCKGGVVGAFYALDVLRLCGFSDRPVHLILQSDEEFGSILSNGETIDFMCEKAKGSKAFINLEGQRVGTACVERKGIQNFIFCITGQEAHSSRCAIAGANAIAEAACKISEIEKIKDDDGLTCSCNQIKGGTAQNTVAGYCEFVVNVRFATKQQYDYIDGFMQKLADTTFVKGCTCELKKEHYRPEMELVKRNTDLLDSINEVLKKCDIPILTMGKSTGGSDAAYVTIAKIPCIDSIGVVGGNIHSPQEYAVTSSLKECAKRLCAIAKYI